MSRKRPPPSYNLYGLLRGLARRIFASERRSRAIEDAGKNRGHCTPSTRAAVPRILPPEAPDSNTRTWVYLDNVFQQARILRVLSDLPGRCWILIWRRGRDSNPRYGYPYAA